MRPEAGRLLEAALYRGEFERGEIDRITGLPERTERRALADVLALGLLASDTPKGKLSLRFPPTRWTTSSHACFRRLERGTIESAQNAGTFHSMDRT